MEESQGVWPDIRGESLATPVSTGWMATDLATV